MSEIKTNEMDSDFKYEISKIPGAERVMLCFQCGTCTADCPIAKYSDFYKPRRIARMVQFGLKEKLLSDSHLWLCSTCYACVDHCPQDVKIAHIVRVLRNLSVKETNTMPLVSKSLAANLLKTGSIYTVPESRLKKRSEQGLPPLPKVNSEIMLRIFDAVGFRKILEEAKTFERVEK